MSSPLLSTLAIAAGTIGCLHTLAPDHWLPIAAVSRARNWNQVRTARVALLCGFGHVTVSAALGLIALFSGTAIVEALGARSASVAGVLLVVTVTIGGISKPCTLSTGTDSGRHIVCVPVFGGF